jgi:hypothetical protein
MRPGQGLLDGVEADLRVPFHRQLHALHERNCFIERKHLAFAVVRNLGQVAVHQFNAATVKERPVARDRDEHRPAAVVRYADDAAIPRHDVSSRASA